LTVDNINVEATIKKVQELLAQEPNLSPALRSTLDVLLLVVQLLANRLGLNSRNSSKPPSTDFVKGDKKTKDGTNKPGGQLGRVGTTLSKVDDPDEIKLLEVDRASRRLRSTATSVLNHAKCSILTSSVSSPNTVPRFWKMKMAIALPPSSHRR
jgi:hypothetical protein